MTSQSQTASSSDPTLVRVSHGTLRSRVGTKWAILVQSSKKGTSCTPVLPRAPSFLPVTLQEQPGPLSISPAWEAGGSGGGRSRGLHRRRKTSLALGQPCILGSSAEALPGRTVRVCNPVSPNRVRQDQPCRISGVHSSCLHENLRGQDGREGHPPLPRTLGLTPAKNTSCWGREGMGSRAQVPGGVGGRADCLITWLSSVS